MSVCTERTVEHGKAKIVVTIQNHWIASLVNDTISFESQTQTHENKKKTQFQLNTNNPFAVSLRYLPSLGLTRSHLFGLFLFDERPMEAIVSRIVINRCGANSYEFWVGLFACRFAGKLLSMENLRNKILHKRLLRMFHFNTTTDALSNRLCYWTVWLMCPHKR